MKVKNNYNECLTNLACSIRKHFELDYNHNTLDYIDKLLEEKQPKNVIVMLFDGMGSRILERTLPGDAFFIKNKYKDITTVFPATTTAATQSMRSGLNPVEHGWMGWNTYIEPIDKTITLFLNTEKGSEETCNEFLNIKDNVLYQDFIPSLINKEGIYSSIELFPFGPDAYNGLDDMLSRIKELSKQEGKKYIYAYDDQPDGTMHDFGPDSIEAQTLIKERNEKVEKLCSELEDSIVIIVADHGHIKVEHIFLNEYPELLNMLERTTALEQRAVAFKIKEGQKENFVNLFNELFGKYFTLYTKEDVIESKLFGDGTPCSIFEPALGDFIAIAENSNKCLVVDGDDILVSQHAGYTDDEIYVPLIIIDKK